jgi:CBS domain containing-hemolysin-like protein
MTEILIPVGIVLLLVVANGLFVAAEFAIVGVSRSSMEHQASQGRRLAKRVSITLSDPNRQDRYIATTQIGISVASLGLGMYGEHVFASWIAVRLEPTGFGQWVAVHAVASAMAVAGLTYLHIVIGEMVPKAYALQRAERTALYVSPVIQGIQTLILPLVVALNAMGNWVLGLIGVRRQEVDSERYHTTEELQFIVEESQEGGLLRGESGRILRELFEFGDLTAGEVMVPRVLVKGIAVGATPDELRNVVREHPHTRYPIYTGDLDNIIGSLHIKEVLRHLITNRPVVAMDARPLPYVPGPAPLDEVLGAMRRHEAHIAVVMDQHGGTAGIVTIEDLFAEVVGDIEEGRSRPPIMSDTKGRLRVRGGVRLSEVGEALDCAIEHPRVTTVSGLVLALLGRPASVGDVVTYRSITIEVTSVAGRGVQEALITKERETSSLSP